MRSVPTIFPVSLLHRPEDELLQESLKLITELPVSHSVFHGSVHALSWSIRQSGFPFNLRSLVAVH